MRTTIAASEFSLPALVSAPYTTQKSDAADNATDLDKQ